MELREEFLGGIWNSSREWGCVMLVSNADVERLLRRSLQKDFFFCLHYTDARSPAEI